MILWIDTPLQANVSKQENLDEELTALRMAHKTSGFEWQLASLNKYLTSFHDELREFKRKKVHWEQGWLWKKSSLPMDTRAKKEESLICP